MRTKQQPAAGIYMITCVPTGHRYIGASANLAQRKSMHWSTLQYGSHCCPKLQRLATEHGIESFRWETLESIEPGPEQNERLRSAEIRHHLQAHSEFGGGLVITQANQAYRRRGEKGNRISVGEITATFRRHCYARGELPADVTVRLMMNYITGPRSRPGPGYPKGRSRKPTPEPRP